MQTSIRNSWQNGVAERWVGRCRRDLVDYIIALNERYLKRLLADYIRYYHEDRTHLGLRKQTPGGRVGSATRVALFLTRGSVACFTATIKPRKRPSLKADLRGFSIFREGGDSATGVPFINGTASSQAKFIQSG